MLYKHNCKRMMVMDIYLYLHNPSQFPTVVRDRLIITNLFLAKYADSHLHVSCGSMSVWFASNRWIGQSKLSQALGLPGNQFCSMRRLMCSTPFSLRPQVLMVILCAWGLDDGVFGYPGTWAWALGCWGIEPLWKETKQMDFVCYLCIIQSMACLESWM